MEWRVGKVRDTMVTNMLLQKRTEVGKVRTRCYTLPGPEFVYGDPNIVRDGGVPEAIGHWDSIESKTFPRKMVRDFLALNQQAISAGLVKPIEHKHYRKTHDVQRFADKDPPKFPTFHLPPDMTFGIPVRPSTPMYDVIEHRFQDGWLQEQRLLDKARQAVQKEKLRLGKIYETRSALLRKFEPPTEPTPLWHLPRFDKVCPHLDTFPTESDRRRAFSARQVEGVARSGQRGLGIYTTG
ncbi:cilia- and flagella-associated protein 77 [Ambystoma mexicanum]|uniref:cilia- and flagella-associated protein 77 n=1 Tax=Ambystoma mexicanum TaxID=8296 RepID=UPI0037E92B26